MSCGDVSYGAVVLYYIVLCGGAMLRRCGAVPCGVVSGGSVVFCCDVLCGGALLCYAVQWRDVCGCKVAACGVVCIAK